MATRGAKLEQKHIDALAKFKVAVKNVARPEYDDDHFLRFLRARNFDVKKSEKMFRDNMEWRKRYETDNVLSWKPPEVLLNYYPGGYYGVDKEGAPIWIDLLGTIDLKGMMFSSSKKDIVKYKVYWMEYLFKNMLPEVSKKYGKKIDQCNIIFDMDGIGLKHLWKPALDVFTEVLRVFEANYPETLKYCYVVNTPSFFPIAWNIVKPFLHEYTRSKVKVLGRGWKDVLLKDIAADQLPKHWGGTATDTDGEPHCKSKICIGGPIPEKFKIANVLENVDMSNFVKTTIGRSASLDLELEVTKPNSMIRYNFWTEGNDVGFGIFMKTKEGKQKLSEMEKIVPYERVNSHMVPEDGTIPALKPGIYVVQFDNSYSWMNAKKISYLLDVFVPDEKMEEELSTDL